MISMPSRGRSVKLSSDRTFPHRTGLTLAVEDDGVGLPGGFDPAVSGGMGMNLVRMLAGQIDGELSVGRRPGTKISVIMKP